MKRGIAAAAALIAAASISIVAVGLASADNEHSLAAVTKCDGALPQSRRRKARRICTAAEAQGITCIDNQPVGGMAVHYAKDSLVGDPANDPEHPEALVYASNGSGQLKLAALEYVVFKADWDATHSARPSLFGRDFDLTPFPNRFALPAFYSLHAWVW